MLISNLELNNFDKYINLLLQKDMQHKMVLSCPHCGDKKIIKYGKYSGVQRFKCKECRKTFSLSTNSVWEYSKKSYAKWIKFIEFFVEKRTLRYCATRLDINLATAFYWRHKILNALNSKEKSKVLKGIVYIGKTSMKENFKGCRKITTPERKKVIIIGGVDIKDTMISETLCRDLWSYKVFNEKIYKKIIQESYLISYGDRYLLKIAKENNDGKFIKCDDDPRIKFFRKNVYLWFKGFRGVATRNLNKYLSWFILDKLKKNIDWISLEGILSSLFNYIRCEEIID